MIRVKLNEEERVMLLRFYKNEVKELNVKICDINGLLKKLENGKQ